MKKLMEWTVTVKTNRKINVEEIEGTDFAFYEDVREIDTDGEKEVKIIKGVTSKENLNKVQGLDFINDVVYAPKMYDKKAVVATIKKSDFNLVLKGKKHISEAIDWQCLVRLPTSEDCMMVLWNSSSHTIADLNYNFIPIPIRLGYMDGCVHNGYYKLNKLLNKLKTDDCVVDRESLQISSIPYYNREDDKDKSIEFKYLLPTDIYERVIQMDCFERSFYIINEIIKAGDCRKKNINTL